MRLFRKPKHVQALPPEVPPETTSRIRTMPDRFYIEKGRRGGNKLFVVLAILLIIGGIVLAGLAVAIWMKNSSSPASIGIPVQPTQPAAMPAFSPTIPSALETPTSPPVAETAQSSPTQPPVVVPSSQLDTTDLDSDGLTGEEELIFSTNANSADTDLDGFGDAAELLAGYDPRLSGRMLASSESVMAYAFYGANFLYPAQWLVKEAGVLLILDTKKGDSVTVSFTENRTAKNQENLITWIQQYDPTEEVSELRQTSLRGYPTVYASRLQLKYYIFSSDLARVWVVNYRQGNAGLPGYPTAFSMIINSFH